MTGAEIQGVFNDPEVLEMEGQLASVETELRDIQETFSASVDPEEQEELSRRMEELRERVRALSSDMRVLQRKFSESAGFNRKAA